MSDPTHEVNEDGECHIIGLNDALVTWSSADCPVCRAERAEARVKELEEELRLCAAQLKRDAQTMLAAGRALRGEEEQ